VSVNHPLRFRGMTVYSKVFGKTLGGGAAGAFTVQIGRSPLLENCRCEALPELGEQSGVCPTHPPRWQ